MRFMQVLFVHYYRFKGALDEEHVVKINHPIEAKASLTVGNKTYSLVGVLVHAGESAETGHYYFTTVCPPYNITRSAYRSNDAAEPEPIGMDQLRADILNAYMLVYQLNDDLPAEQSATTVPPTPKVLPQQNVEEEVDEMYFKDLLRKRDAILNTKAKDRSQEERSEYKRLAEEIKKLKDKFPSISVKPASKAKTTAEKVAALRQNKTFRDKERERDRERMATPEAKEKTCARMATTENKEKTRARMATDENKAKDCARKATSENKAKTRERLATDEYKAANLQQKTAKKAGLNVKAKDGLKTELIFSGRFGVEVNSLGAMDNVSHYIMQSNHLCILSGVSALRRPPLQEGDRNENVLCW